MSILDRPLRESPIAVIDLETTGLSAKSDRIVEIAVTRIDPGNPPRLVLDTLVDPQRRVTCSEIHGIYDEDVERAPLFRDLIGPISEAIDGAVVASFNVYFDIKFLEAELAAAKVPLPIPHLCLMWLRPALGLGARASLESTCKAMGVTQGTLHRAATDAMASAQLWPHYLSAATTSGIHTFADLAAAKAYKFMKSWTSVPLSPSSVTTRPLRTSLKPRREARPEEQRNKQTQRIETRDALLPYLNALTCALVDRQVTAEEMQELRRLQAQPGLTPEMVRFVHGRVFAGLLDEITGDMRVTDAEVTWLHHVGEVLRELGWSPGDLLPDVRAPRRVDVEPVARGKVSRIELLPEDKSWWSRMFG